MPHISGSELASMIYAYTKQRVPVADIEEAAADVGVRIGEVLWFERQHIRRIAAEVGCPLSRLDERQGGPKSPQGRR